MAAEKPTKFDSLVTTDGKSYSGVTVREVTPSGIRIMHESGTATIPFEKLPKEIQDQFGGFDPDKAAEHVKQEAARQRMAEEALARDDAQQASVAKATAETAKQIELDKKSARWIVGKVQRVQENGVLVKPPGEYDGRVSRVSDADQLGLTAAAQERFKRERSSLPGDFQAYLNKGGTFFGSVQGMKYIASNWIKAPSDYQKYFSLERLFQTRSFLDSFAVYPPVDSEQAVFVKTASPLGVVDGDYVSLWIVPDDTAKSEGGRTFRGYRILGAK